MDTMRQQAGTIPPVFLMTVVAVNRMTVPANGPGLVTLDPYG